MNGERGREGLKITQQPVTNRIIENIMDRMNNVEY
jgi:hypothetical protein